MNIKPASLGQNNFLSEYSTPALFHSREPSSRQTTLLVVGEYFASTLQPAAKSNVDYLESPIKQIQEKLNEWLASLGSRTQLACEEASLTVAPASKIAPEFFDEYEPFFRTIFLYQARLGSPEIDDPVPPTEEQMNAAFLGLANLMAAFIPAPSPMLLDDGTIGGYWRKGKFYASIDFEVDGEHTWVETNGEDFRSGTWRLPGQPAPPALINELYALIC